MKKIVLLALALVVALFFANNIFAQKGKHRLNCEKLNLSDAQKEKFEKIRFSHEEIKIDIDSKINKNKLEAKKMMASNNISEAALLNLVEEGSNLRNEMQKNRMKMWFEVYNILDESQKEIWKDKFHMFEKNHKKFSKRKECKNERNFRKNDRM